MTAKVVTVMRCYAQDEVNQEDSEQNEVDGMKVVPSRYFNELKNFGRDHPQRKRYSSHLECLR